MEGDDRLTHARVLSYTSLSAQTAQHVNLKLSQMKLVVAIYCDHITFPACNTPSAEYLLVMEERILKFRTPVCTGSVDCIVAERFLLFVHYWPVLGNVSFSLRRFTCNARYPRLRAPPSLQRNPSIRPAQSAPGRAGARVVATCNRRSSADPGSGACSRPRSAVLRGARTSGRLRARWSPRWLER